MGTSEVEKVVAKQVDEWVNRVVTSRDEIAEAMRRGQRALAEARIASLALAAIHPGHDYIGQQEKYDAEVRELIAELAGLFVDETAKADAVEVKFDGARVQADDLTLKVSVGDAVVTDLGGASLSGAYSAELLIDEAAKKIVQRLRGSGGPGATFSEPMVAWLDRLESRVRFYFTEQEKSL